MNYETYQNLRGYCWQDLSPYIDTKSHNSSLEWMRGFDGQLTDINHEYTAAIALFQTNDLTPRERAAAKLLAVVSDHRRYAWWREAVTPDGTPPVEPLEPWQAAELWTVTRLAVTKYAAFIPERESAALMALVKATAHAKPADGLAKPASNKTDKTLKFEAKVIELMGKFWNDRVPNTKPTKAALCKLVYTEMLRGLIRGERDMTESMVRDAAKPWKFPLVLPALVPDAKFNEKRPLFKGEK